MSLATADRAAPAFDWKRWPETEALVDRVDRAGARGERLRREPGRADARRDEHPVRGLGRPPGRRQRARACRAGFTRSATSLQPEPYAVGAPVYAHPGASSRRSCWRPVPVLPVREVAIKVESVAAFSRAHDLGLEIVGQPLGPYRVGRIAEPANARPGGRRTARAIWASSPSRAAWPRGPDATPRRA